MNGNTMSHVTLSVKGENFLNKPFLYTKSVSFFAIQRSTLSLEKNWLYGPWMYWEKFPNGLMGQGEVLDPKERKINEQYTHCSTLWSLPLKSNILTHRLFFQCVSGLHCFLWQRALGSFWSRNCPSTTRGSEPGLGSEWVVGLCHLVQVLLLDHPHRLWKASSSSYDSFPDTTIRIFFSLHFVTIPLEARKHFTDQLATQGPSGKSYPWGQVPAHPKLTVLQYLVESSVGVMLDSCL